MFSFSCLCWQQHENLSSKQGRFWFLGEWRIPASTAAGHSRGGFGGAHHLSPEVILTRDSSGDFTTSFAKKSHNRRSQGPAGLPSSTLGGTAPWPALPEGCTSNPDWQHSLGSEFSVCLHRLGEWWFQEELRHWNYVQLINKAGLRSV